MIQDQELIVDNFAGGGGASLGIERATGRPIDIAINHDPVALAMHRANHPNTLHLQEDVWGVDPVAVCQGRPVGLNWFSPDCTHHSKAKGGKPLEGKRRALAWVVLRWAGRKRPRIIMLENVEEFADWGPLTRSGRPCRTRRGTTFRQWVAQLQGLGYEVDWRELKACDYGAPTVRKRLFLTARCDGAPIRWADPTHGPDGLLPYRTAAEIIDWSLSCPSIFLTREQCKAMKIRAKRPLAENTMKRIAKGVVRYVLNDPKPFIIKHRTGSVGHPVDEPLHTVTANSYCKRPGGATPLGLVVPTLIQTGYGERAGQAPRVPGLQRPIGVQVAGGVKHALVAAFLAQHNTDMVGHDVRKPLSTLVQKGCNQNVVAAHLINFKGSARAMRALEEPVPTVCASTCHAGLVAAFLTKYYGAGVARGVDVPLDTVTTKPRFNLVTVSIDGESYAIADIGMRMLTPRERFRAQGFPDSYRIDLDVPGPNGLKPITQEQQGSACGNSVCPDVAYEHVKANAGFGIPARRGVA